MNIAVYGSLRYGNYNHERILNMFPKSLNLLKTTVLKGYTLHDLGAYPAITKSEDEDSEVTVDIMECTNDDALEFIKVMESGAGYEETIVNIDGYDCLIFYMNDLEENLIEEGDWNIFLDK